MKQLIAMGIITCACFLGEILNLLLPLPVPASVYGLIILLLLLITGLVKVEQVEPVSNFFMSVMPIFFLGPSIKLMTSVDILKESFPAILGMGILSTIAVVCVTGLIAQLLSKGKENDDEHN